MKQNTNTYQTKRTSRRNAVCISSQGECPPIENLNNCIIRRVIWKSVISSYNTSPSSIPYRRGKRHSRNSKGRFPFAGFYLRVPTRKIISIVRTRTATHVEGYRMKKPFTSTRLVFGSMTNERYFISCTCSRMLSNWKRSKSVGWNENISSSNAKTICT